MSPTLIPAAVLVAITVVGILVLRRFSTRARLTFDVVCFLAISLYLFKEQIVPVFPPLAEPIEGRAIGLRALAGGTREKLDTKSPHRLLGDLVLFEKLEPEQIRKIAAQAEPRQLEPGERLFAEGAEDTSLYVIASGVLEFTRQTPSALEAIGCIGAGEYVGEIGLLTGTPHAATATARTHCHIFQLPREAIAPLLSGNASLAAAFDRAVRRGLEILNREVATRATPSVGPAGQLLMRIRRIFH